MHFIFLCFIVIIIVKVMSQSSHLPWEPIKVIHWGALFVLAHFKALHFIVSHFPSCLFSSVIYDTHIISPPSIVSFAYEHFQTELYVIGFFIQPQKCIAWSPFGLPLNVDTSSQFTTLFEIISLGGIIGHLNFHIILHQRCPSRGCSTYEPSPYNG
jgi:hypothetical protein